MIGRSVSHYKILERIGGGGMGVVFRAEDTKLRRIVALKFLPRELGGDEVAKKRFMREAQAASALDHPNICNIYEIDETDEGQLFIAMAYYDGDSLKDLVAKKPLGVREAFEIGMAIVQGLSRAHKNGIVHRDIKPANIMITRDGFVKIVDFGLAKLEGASRVTHSQYTVGTVAYMSPEQAAGEKVDQRTDIWALGVVMYEMLTGKIPWRGAIDQAVIYSIMSQDPVPLDEVVPEVPAKLASIVSMCLAKDPKERYQTTDELIEDFGVVARELGWGSSIAMRSVSPITRTIHRKWPRITAIATVTLAVVVAGWSGWQRFGPQAEQSVYVTENRIAVLPLENMIGVAENNFSIGLSGAITYIAEELGRGLESTWVVPNARIVKNPIASPTEAVETFGANQVVIGSLQRFADLRRVSLQLCDATDLSVIRTANLHYDDDSGEGLADSLAYTVATLLAIESFDDDILSVYGPAANSTAMSPFLVGLGLLESDVRGENTDRAIASLESAVSRDSDFPMALATLGRTHLDRYIKKGISADLDMARSYLERAVADAPQSVYPNIYAADLYFQMKLYPEAIERCKAALRAAPGHPRASKVLGQSYNRQGRFDEALGAFTNSIRRYPDLWVPHYNAAYFYYLRDRLDDAFASWEKALLYAPGDVTTLNNIGAVYHLTGEWRQARSYFERAFKIRPTCQTCQNMGMSYFFEKKYEEATRYYEFALEYCDTTEYDTWGNLAAAQYWTEDGKEGAIVRYRIAQQHLTRELEADPDNPYLIATLIHYSTKSGDWETGMKMIAYGDSVAGDDADVLFETGDAYERQGKRQLAMRYLANAVRQGYSVIEIERTPSLRELVNEPVFKQMISQEVEGETTPPSDASSN